MNLNTPICLDIILRNKGRFNINAKIYADTGSNEFLIVNELFQDNDEIDINIPSGKIENLRIFLRPLTSGEKLQLPRLSINYDAEVKTLDPGFADVRFMIHPPIIGLGAHQFLRIFREKLSNRRRNSFIHLFGHSGTGKTRLLEEVQSEILAQGGEYLHLLEKTERYLHLFSLSGVLYLGFIKSVGTFRK